MELFSGEIPPDQYIGAIDRTVQFLGEIGAEEILVAYGWGRVSPDELLYEDIRMPLSKLMSFIAESEDRYRPGRDNLHLSDPDGRFQILLCHESDIHFVSDDPLLVERLKQKWDAEGRETYLVPATGSDPAA